MESWPANAPLHIAIIISTLYTAGVGVWTARLRRNRRNCRASPPRGFGNLSLADSTLTRLWNGMTDISQSRVTPRGLRCSVTCPLASGDMWSPSDMGSNNRLILMLRHAPMMMLPGKEEFDCNSGNKLPPQVHAVLTKEEIRDGKIIVIGDIHGCSRELQDLLAKFVFLV